MHVKRLTLIGIAAIAAGYTFLSSAGPAVDAPRPQAQAAAPASARTCAPAARQPGEIARTCHASLARFDLMAGLKPLPLAMAGLDFEPVNLAGTPMASFTSLGGLAEAFDQARSRLYRSFRMPDGHTLTLLEHDLSVDGLDPRQALQDDAESVNGLPAHLEVLQGESGGAISILSWREGARAYALWVDADVAPGDARARLLALAAALPKSVPADPDHAGMITALGPQAVQQEVVPETHAPR